jgi:predicted transcriptional regulator
MEALKAKMDTLLGLEKAPSQFTIFFHLLSTGKTMTVKEMSEELALTPKATERAVSKLMEKDMVQRSNFRDGGYNVDAKGVLMVLLAATMELCRDRRKTA